MATTLQQLSSQASSAASNPSSCFPAWLPNNALAIVASNTTPPYNYPLSGNASPGYPIPFLRFQKVSGVFANGDFIDDLVMPQGLQQPGAWYVVDYTANATPALPAGVTLGQVGPKDATFSASAITITQSFTSGYPLPTAAALTTPPYIINNQAAPFLRFCQSGALATGLIVADLVMPNGHQNPSSFYLVRYTLNASLQLS